MMNNFKSGLDIPFHDKDDSEELNISLGEEKNPIEKPPENPVEKTKEKEDDFLQDLVDSQEDFKTKIEDLEKQVKEMQEIIEGHKHEGKETATLSNFDASNITHGKLTALLFRTAISGKRVEIRADMNAIYFYDAAGNLKSELYGDTHGLVMEGNTQADVLDVNTLTIVSSGASLVPAETNETDIGSGSLKFANVYAVNVHTGDITLENGWKITENEKVGIKEEGISFINKKGKIITTLTKEGFKNYEPKTAKE